jgi:iron complex outermembrane receptor protein
LVGLPNAPEYTYNLAVQYRAPSGLFSRVELQGFGTTFFAPLKQGPFAIVNARLGYEFKNYGIYLFGNNILDTEYLTAGVTFPGFGNYVSYGIPATYGVQLKMRF